MPHTPEESLFSKPAAITPPATAAERMAWLRLARSRRVGPATFLRLIGEHGSAEAALAALPAIAAAAGAKEYTPTTEDDAKREAATARALGARLLCLGEADYPKALATIPDPPPCLWARGNTTLATRPTIALVGARNASALGLRMTETLAREAGALGYTVASGLARGIDTAAHKAALETGTIAVLAGGLDCPYPRENAALMEEIAEQGLLLTEARMGLQPQARHFPPRNRIVSGLAEAVVVVEAAARSGTLITARNALDQGREVLAVPGHPFDARASGCNLLIRDGATLVRSGEDIAAALGQKPPARPVPGQAPAPAAAPAAPADLSHQLLNLLGPAPISEDALIRQLGLPAGPVLEALTDLDLSGQIARHPGGLVSRAVA
ncbi:MAG: DNA-processing protein DprA [Pseudomonadota bacterium]